MRPKEEICTILEKFKTGLLSREEAISQIFNMFKVLEEELKNMKKILNEYNII